MTFEHMKSPLVIGYKGEIGSFILQGLLRVMPKALNIWCYDINETEQEKIDRITKADVIFLCVPLDKTIDWFQRYSKFLKGKTVIEQCSLKEMLFKKIKPNGFTLLSMHILFRPSATPTNEVLNRNVALIKHSEWSRYKGDIEQITQSRIVWFSNIEIHDATMAYQQALIHRVILTLGEMLTGLEGSTYISNKIKELSKRIQQGDIILYDLIQKNNFLPKTLGEFNKKLKNFDIKDHFDKKG